MPSPRVLATLLVAGALGLGPRALEAQRDPSVVGLQLGFARASLESFALSGASGTLSLPDARDGAHVGVYFRQRLLPVVWLQPELNFVLKGGAEQFAGTGTVELELGYLELPMMIRLAPTYRRKAIRPVLFGGPAISFRISCALGGTLPDSSLATICQEGATGAPGVGDTFTGVETSGIVGGGVELDRAGIAIALEARYSWGLSDVLANSGGGKNRFFALLFALSL